MDKIYRKQFRKNGDKRARIGIPLGIHDCNGTELKTGDKVKWGEYEGILLWYISDSQYWFLTSDSKWYGDNEYDADSYGKGLPVPMDDGARMEMRLL